MSDTAYEWTVERRIGYPLITEVRPSPDGSRVLCVIREPLLTDEKSEFVGHVYRASTGGDLEQLTFGECDDAAPRWSPDGRYVAFVSRRGGKANLYVMRADGGEAWPLTRSDKTDVARAEWAPDGRRLAFVMAEPPSEEKERARRAKDDAIHYDVDHEFAHIYVVPFAVGPRTMAQPRQVTHGRLHVLGLEWLPDGERIVFTHRPTPTDDSWPETRLAVVSVGVDSAAPRDLGLAANYWVEPKVSPDGRWVACVAAEEPARWAFSARVVLYPSDGGRPRPLASTPDGTTTPVGWSADGSEFYTLDVAGVTSQFWALPASGGPGRQLSDTDLAKRSAANSGDKIVFVGQDFHQPNAIACFDVASGATAEVARPSLPPEWPTGPLPRAEVIHWQAPDGQTIEGILAYPLHYRPGERCPLVVQVHGGPAGAYQRAYQGALEGTGADIPGLAERGYAVLQPNPRGSSGYGQQFRFANRGDWGGGDYQDVMAGVDYLVAQGIADPDRLAIQGWSYGGYLTAWAITQSERFRAACVGAGLTDLFSMTGTCDIPGFLPDYLGSEFWDDAEVYRARSPLFSAKGVRTATLILHGEQDRRVPLSQGHELHNALKRQGTPVEMVVYPRTAHGLSEPRLIMDAARRTLEWLVRWTAIER